MQALQVARIEFNRVTVTQHTLDRLACCKRLVQLHLKACVITGGRLPPLPYLRDITITASRCGNLRCSYSMQMPWLCVSLLAA